MAVIDSTSKKPGVIARAAQAVRYVIAGVTPETWMSPMQPLKPMAPADVKGRAFDYPVAWNLNYIPRATEPLSFDRLKSLAENCGVLRAVIETRKDQLEALEWIIRPKELRRGERPEETKYAGRIKEITEFLKSPDQRLDWAQWFREIAEQHFVYDAACVFRRKTRGGKLFALEVVDGATIKVLLDADGRIPTPPSPAYQQVLKGIPAADYAQFTTGDMHYYPQNMRVDRGYGYPRTAQIIAYVETMIARVRSQVAYYQEGNIPDGLLEGPASMTTAQIESMQEHWDALFSGNIEQRRRAWWVPQGTKYTPLKKDPVVDEFDEWLARVICYAFSISHQPFTKSMNRATAQSAQETAEAEGLRPTMNFFKRFMNRIIEMDFGEEDLEFAWDEDVEFDPVKQATMHNIYARLGAISLDRVRDDIGEDPIGGMFSEPMYATPNGWVPVDPEERMELTPPPGAGGPPGANAPPQAGKPGQPQPKPGQPGQQAQPQPGAPQPGNMNKRYEPLYVSRPLLNSHDLVAWAKSQGFPSTLEPSDMHVTVAYSRLPVEWDTINEASSMVYVEGGARSVEPLGDEGAVVLKFESDDLSGRWHEFIGHGLSWDYENYQPHVTIAYAGGIPERSQIVEKDVEVGKEVVGEDGQKKLVKVIEKVQEKVTIPVEPYTGALFFGEERFLAIDPVTGHGVKPKDDVTKLTRDELDAAAAETERNPSEAQIAAGNYKKGHVTIHGLDVSIENEAGSRRSGTDNEGNSWSVVMPTHYGYIKRTEGADGDHVDCYIGTNPESERVWIIDQHDADSGEFDEHKVMLGYDTWSAAQRDYLAAFSDGRGHERLGSVTSMDIDTFKTWLSDGDQNVPINGAAVQPGKDQNVEKGIRHPEPTHSKGSVEYSPGKGDTRCHNCRFFYVSTSDFQDYCCEKVKGDIDPDYWCKLFEERVEKGHQPRDHGGRFKQDHEGVYGNARQHSEMADKHRETATYYRNVGQNGDAAAHDNAARAHARAARSYDRASMHFASGNADRARAAMSRGDAASAKANERSAGLPVKGAKDEDDDGRVMTGTVGKGRAADYPIFNDGSFDFPPKPWSSLVLWQIKQAGEFQKVYNSVDELPQSVKDKIKSPKRRRQWMHVWNSIYHQTGDEARAFAGAWSQAQKVLEDA